ncbi:DUF1116 domain-containing protein [Cupriavidus gilardii]|uniref:oxamate carbamoyltransferase subunit AllG family protein n=1 Tax=Cupriavidus gilardii TaxID=82541 RepID=UPI001FD02BC1|nr:DUF1116 domain-containing protein [Cupriavidus gilardii]MCT9069900.1 DUF1116 domain-containing protein [Cupriavidus gilardii]
MSTAMDAIDANEAARRAANARVLARLASVQPAWTAVRPAREALGLAPHTLLHAGPPLTDPCRPPKPLLASAVLCCLYEGWASDAMAAEHAIACGRIALRPTQDFGAVTPLAALISPSSALVEVVDLAAAGSHAVPARAWSLLGSGAGPQLRFGSRDPAILPRLAWRDRALARRLNAVLAAGPLALLPLAATGLAAGDDLHARTTAANTALCERLIPALGGVGDGAADATEEADGGDDGEDGDARAVARMLRQTPLFFLTLWMAACHLMLDRAADGGRDAASSLVVALAGNGERVGIRLAGQPHRWHTAPAAAPVGPPLNASAAGATASPVIGDSGVIDALGCGGQALTGAPEIAAALAPWLPADWRARSGSLLAGRHPGLAPQGLAVGLDAASIVTGREPLTAIAMIDAAGELGLLGRGLFVPPASLFAQAAGDIAAAAGEA